MAMKRWPLDTSGPLYTQAILLDDSKVKGNEPDADWLVVYQFPQPDIPASKPAGLLDGVNWALKTLAEWNTYTAQRRQDYRQQCVSEATALAKVEAQARAQAVRQGRSVNDAGVTTVNI